jgi:hypothetical protein
MTGAGFLRGYFCEVDFIKPLNQMMMKNVLILLFFFSGFATTTLQAQSCCLPCPPECCVQMGCVPGANFGDKLTSVTPPSVSRL